MRTETILSNTKTYFVVNSPLLPLDANIVHAYYYSAWFGILSKDGWHALGCGASRVRGTLLQCRGQKGREGGKHDCLQYKPIVKTSRDHQGGAHRYSRVEFQSPSVRQADMWEG